MGRTLGILAQYFLTIRTYQQCGALLHGAKFMKFMSYALVIYWRKKTVNFQRRGYQVYFMLYIGFMYYTINAKAYGSGNVHQQKVFNKVIIK